DDPGPVSHGRARFPCFPSCATSVRAAPSSPLEEVPADDRHILEYPPSKSEEGDQIEVDPQAVTEEREARGEQEVRIEARNEDARGDVTLGPGRAAPVAPR